MARRREPTWLSRRVVDALHDAQLREHGGRARIRDDGLLESALARPRQKWTYESKPDLAALAAAYAFGLVKNHAYIDGNNRVGFVAAYVFLALNDQELDAEETAVVTTIEGVAAGKVSEARLAAWIRAHLEPLV